MSDSACLYTVLHAPRDRHDALLLDFVLPVVREIDEPPLESLFFARYNKPEWQLRFRVLGEPRWIDERVRPLIEERLPALRKAGAIAGYAFATYEREWERYGGVEGMRLAEQLFLHDSRACLEVLDAEARGAMETSRREYSLALVESFLELFAFEREARIAFYRMGYQWAIDLERWDGEELGVLEARYRSLKPHLLERFEGEAQGGPALFGGEVPAAIARSHLAAASPVVAELLVAHAAGRIAQDLVHLAWSYAHMHCNRLGIEATPEAILRFFMHRYHEDRSRETA